MIKGSRFIDHAFAACYIADQLYRLFAQATMHIRLGSGAPPSVAAQASRSLSRYVGDPRLSRDVRSYPSLAVPCIRRPRWSSETR